MSIRTRFPPSPTGHIHLGSIRTALYCWLYAKKQNGVFVLRIEDTDHIRSSKSFIEIIIDSLKWLGLNWDEGPYLQTKRFHRYNEVLETLLMNGYAYKCYCSKERIRALKEQQVKLKLKPK